MTDSDIATVRAGFEAVARGDLAGFKALFAPDATWNHRNDDRFAGLHKGPDAIAAFLTESVQLTAGTLRPLPQTIMSSGQGQVAVHTHLTASRPDGRHLEDMQILLFTLNDGLVESVDQYIGDPRTVTDFWA